MIRKFDEGLGLRNCVNLKKTFKVGVPVSAESLQLKRPLCWIALAFVFLLSSIFMGRSYEELVSFSEEQKCCLEGKIVSKSYKEAAYGGYWQIVLKNVNILVEEKERTSDLGTEDLRSLEGKYMCRLDSKENVNIRIGQQVLVTGTFVSWEEASNPGQFDLGEWYCSQGILGQFKKCTIRQQGSAYSVVGENMWQLRNKLQQQLQQELGEKDGGLISAMLLGEKSSMEEESKNLYQRNGISHVLAISGVNTLNLVSLSNSQMPNLRASPQVLLRKFTLFYYHILSGFCPLVVLPLFKGYFPK